MNTNIIRSYAYALRLRAACNLNISALIRLHWQLFYASILPILINVTPPIPSFYESIWTHEHYHSSAVDQYYEWSIIEYKWVFLLFCPNKSINLDYYSNIWQSCFIELMFFNQQKTEQLHSLLVLSFISQFPMIPIHDFVWYIGLHSCDAKKVIQVTDIISLPLTCFNGFLSITLQLIEKCSFWRKELYNAAPPQYQSIDTWHAYLFSVYIHEIYQIDFSHS